jgi:hypothetical protein
MKRKSDGVVLNWPTPDNFTLATNIEQRVQMGRNKQGRKVRTGSYVAGTTPELSISYNYIQPEMLSFNVGNEQAAGTFDTYIPLLMEVSSNEVAGDAAGYLMQGVVANDARVSASVTRNLLSTALTRQDYDTFDPTTDDSFALGADGALKYSNNLVAANELVSLLIPHNVTGITLSDVLVGPHEVYALMVDTLNQITIFEARNVTPNVEGKSIDFGGEGLEMSLFLNNLPGECSAWNVYATPLKVACI